MNIGFFCPPAGRPKTAEPAGRRRRDRIVLAIAALELLIVLLLPAPPNPDKPGISGGLRTAAAQLRGDGPPVDLVQDYAGARSLVLEGDSYAVLSKAYADVGLRLQPHHRSTHPPTAFVLVLPVAWLPWKPASATWAWLMLAAIAGAWWAFGARPASAAALAPLTLVWPPGAWSLGQLTPLWLLGLALAWRRRAEPARAGAAIAFASLTKLLPALSLVPLLIVRQFRALRGFAVVWAAAVGIVLLLNANALERYFEVGFGGGREQAGRGDNSAFLPAAWHDFGAVGVAIALGLVASAVALSMERLGSRRNVDRWSWDAWTWIGVALLPIAWIYSLLPLLPAALRITWRGAFAARPFALAALVLPFLVDPFGLPGGLILAHATAGLGIALLVEAAGDRPTLPQKS